MNKKPTTKKPAPKKKWNGKGKNPGGRPSKLDDKMKGRLKKLYLKGFTDAEVCHAVDITDNSLQSWKKKHPEFFGDLKDWKLEADKSIERSLRERAEGFLCPETKAQWVQDAIGGGRWEYAEMIKHYPPDPTSMIFWLKNRQPDKWRDKQELDVNASVVATVKLDEKDKEDIVKLLTGLKETIIAESRKSA